MLNVTRLLLSGHHTRLWSNRELLRMTTSISNLRCISCGRPVHHRLLFPVLGSSVRLHGLHQLPIRLYATDKKRKLPLPPIRDKKFEDRDKDRLFPEDHPSQNGGSNGNDKDTKRMQKEFAALAIGSLVACLLVGAWANPRGATSISADTFFNEILPSGEVQSVTIRTPTLHALVRLHDGAVINGMPVSSGHIFMLDLSKQYGHANQSPDPAANRRRILGEFEMRLAQKESELGIPPSKRIGLRYERLDWVFFFLTFGLMLVLVRLLMLTFRFWGRRLGITSIFDQFRQARYRLVDRKSADSFKTPNIKFSDVAGLHEAKTEVQEFVDYLKRPEAYTKLGARLPKGALLLGPPGCGKTLLAKAVATEANVPCMAMSGTDFVEMIGGLGASRVRSLFNDAKKRAPCIVFIDEIDAIGRQRSGGTSMHPGDSETEQTLMQLLVEMDGMGSNAGVVVLASTNRSDILDKALLRPGRFDRHVTIDLPTLSERREIFELYLGQIKLHDDAKQLTARLANMTPSFSGADIRNVVNEAAIHAGTNKKSVVVAADFDYALDRVLAGTQKRTTTLSPDEKLVVAYHESGHALIGWLLKHTDALMKVTILPRTAAALGFAQYSPSDRKLFSKEELFDRMCMALGGRAAENLIFERTTTGAEDDLKKVTNIAYAQVKHYGMSETVGPLSWDPTDSTADFAAKPYSKYLAALIDAEASRMIVQAYRHTEHVLKENREKLDKIAKSLLKKETLTYDDVKSLIGPPPHGEKQTIEQADANHLFPELIGTADETSSPPRTKSRD